MDWTHHSATQLGPLENVDPMVVVGLKPRGLWLSRGTAWADYVREHGAPLCLGACEYRVRLRPDANLYVVDSLEAALEVQRRFGSDWAAMAAAGYDGLEVRGFQRMRARFLFSLMSADILWLYAFDVDSACVWNAASAVARIELCKTV